eukprot:TRINITY_DN19719_c0_g1_i1.p1 TRINITY_DN19719_c0_g1~~TRINITY_DN19719_c0_g1_i1.p1  ORF type:complete len:358 (+),score=48.80 TRINITY_DN19719_c0_g1_i1:60-1133(+)
MEHPECCICLDPLCKGTVAVLADGNSERVCPHYFHGACVEAATGFQGAERLCPMCRTEFSHIIEMPDPMERPDAWFCLVDVSRSGALSKQDVLNVVTATCPVDEAELESLLDARWGDWVSDSGGVTAAELPALLAFVKERLPASERRHGGRSTRPLDTIPDIKTQKGAWFDFWDLHGTGTLDRETTLSAIVRTLNAGQSDFVGDILHGLDQIWPVFAGSYISPISKDAFVDADGLGDTVVAMLMTSKRFQGPDSDAGSPSERDRGRPRHTVDPRDSTPGSSSGASDVTQRGRPRQDSGGLVLLPRVAVQVPRCVVCGRQNAAGLARKSGWKCRTCIGVPHRQGPKRFVCEAIGCRGS